MAKRKQIVITNSREIYEKFSMLKFMPEIVLKNVKPIQVNRIVKSINKHNKILDTELVGEYIVVKKINPTNFDIYLK